MMSDASASMRATTWRSPASFASAGTCAASRAATRWFGVGPMREALGQDVREALRPRQERVGVVVVLEALLDRIPEQLALGPHPDVMQQARRAGAMRDFGRRDRL